MPSFAERDVCGRHAYPVAHYSWPPLANYEPCVPRTSSPEWSTYEVIDTCVKQQYTVWLQFRVVIRPDRLIDGFSGVLDIATTSQLAR